MGPWKKYLHTFPFEKAVRCSLIKYRGKNPVLSKLREARRFKSERPSSLRDDSGETQHVYREINTQEKPLWKNCFDVSFFFFVWSSNVQRIRPRKREKQGLLCVYVGPPAFLWWVGVFGPCVAPPCWRKRAAPLTMKKLSLRLEKAGVKSPVRGQKSIKTSTSTVQSASKALK